MKTISFSPNQFDRYIECSNLYINGNITVENNGGAYIGNFTPLKKRELNNGNYYVVVGRWKLKNNKMNNTIQRRLKRERKIMNALWLFLALVIAFVIFSCSSDDEDNCNCVKETYTTDVKFLYDTNADESKCNGDNALRVDEFGTLYRYTCK